MIRILSSLFGAMVLALCLPTLPAEAQLARTFVSAASGNDGNDCSRLTPCRTFQRAHDNSLANGEITVLDAGGYGAVTITKTISIINDGVGEAGVLVSGGANGITVNAGSGDAVGLRGLTIKGIGFGGGNGIVFLRGKSLTIENCAVRNLNGGSGLGFGIVFRPDLSGTLAVTNTIVADNSADGVLVFPNFAGGTAAVALERVELFGNVFGVDVLGDASTGTIDVTVTDSVAAGNAGTGFYVQSSAAEAALMVVDSVSVNNGTGLAAAGTQATLRFGNTAVTGNTTSWTATSGSILRSYGDNNIDGNADSNPLPITISRK